MASERYAKAEPLQMIPMAATGNKIIGEASENSAAFSRLARRLDVKLSGNRGTVT